MKKLLEVKKQIGTLSKKSTNPFFKSKYLDLRTLLENVEPILEEQGLLLLQPIQNGLVQSVIIDSESGEVLVDSCLPLPDIKDPQKLGMAITYFRRYTLTSLLAISEKDDDGNEASKPESTIIQDLLDCKTMDDLKEVWSSKKGHTEEEIKLKDELKTKLK